MVSFSAISPGLRTADAQSAFGGSQRTAGWALFHPLGTRGVAQRRQVWPRRARRGCSRPVPTPGSEGRKGRPADVQGKAKRKDQAYSP